MLRKSLLTVAVLFAFPVLANATWYVTATASKSAGDTTSRVKPAGSTAIPGFSGFKNISAIAGPGFQVNRVTLDGISLCTNPSSAGIPLCANTAFYQVPYLTGKTYRTIVAYFGPATVSGSTITVTPPANSSYRVLSPVNGSLTDIAKGDSRTIALIPLSGYAVNAVTVGGPGAGACTVSDSGQFAGGKNIACVDIQDAITIGGTTQVSQVVTASAGPDRTMNGTGPASAVTLNGSATYAIGPVTYAWSAVGANAASAHFGTPAAASTTFYADAPGTYTVQLIATAAGPTTSAPAAATITVINQTDYLEAQCTPCHASRNAAVVANYDTSKHKTATAQTVACQTCHDPAGSGHYTDAAPAAVCAGCHIGDSGNVPNHLVQIGTIACPSCHDPHTTAASRISPLLPPPHFNSVTSAGYPASYAASRSSCRDCHSTAGNNAAIRADWAASGHGSTNDLPWRGYDFKSEDGCVRCHTTTGYVNYVTSDFVNVSAWGDPADKTKEVLACNGCHNPDFSRRAFNLTGPTGPTFTYSFPVSGTTVTDSYQFLSPISPTGIVNTDSNICMLCHRGTVNGEIIKKATAFADFTGVGRLMPHGMAAAGMLGDLSGAGYNYNEDYHVFSGKSDLSRHWSYHEYIGSANYNGTGYNGACVTCHMSGTQHTFAAVFKNTTGSITGLTTQAICNKCHPSVTVAGPMDVTTLKARKAGFAAALLVLKAQLQKSGFDPDSSDPKNWGGTAPVRANNMGAYYNYFLLRDGDRASYVHGPAYTRRLILSSLTWLDDNTFNVSAYATIFTLASEGRITATTRDSAIGFLGITSVSGTLTGICANCHPGHSGSFNPY